MMAKRTSLTSLCRTTLLSLITVCSLLNTSLAVQSSWLFDSPFESSNCINTIPIIQTSTKLQCATLCGQSNGSCLGFFHNKDTLSCLHIDPTASSDCMVNNSLQWTSWKKRTDTATEQTTTPTTTMAPPTCPNTLPTNTYTSTTLSDNTQFTYLFVNDQVNQAEALSRCPNYNGTLVQIITAPKMDFLKACLDETSNGQNVWMDAIKVDGLWETSDGKAVLSDANYWKDGLWATQYCAFLHGVDNSYQMNSNFCRRTNRFLCEKTN